MPNLDDTLVRKLRKQAEKLTTKGKQYRVERVLGVGGSAAVFEAVGPRGRVALKVYDPSFFSGQDGTSQRRRMTLQKKLIGVTNEYLAEIYSVINRERTCFVIMEYCSWPTLKAALPDIPVSAITPLFKQLVADALALDKLGLVHRDIKPENILVSPDFTRLKLIDFGVMRDTETTVSEEEATDHGKWRPFIATAQYSSPEYLFRLAEPDREAWLGLTFYQLGAVLHDLIKREPLFDMESRSGNRYKLAWSVLNSTPAIPIPDLKEGNTLAALASACLAKDLQLRLKLVSWERLGLGGEDEIDGLRRRFVGLRELAQKTELNDQSPSGEPDRDLANKLLDGLKLRLISEYGSNCQIRRVRHAEKPTELHVTLPKFKDELCLWLNLERNGMGCKQRSICLYVKPPTANHAKSTTAAVVDIDTEPSENVYATLLRFASRLIAECLDVMFNNDIEIR